jgi:hypothetical protein
MYMQADASLQRTHFISYIPDLQRKKVTLDEHAESVQTFAVNND